MTDAPTAKSCPFCGDVPEIEGTPQINRAWPKPDEWVAHEASCCGITMDLATWNTRADLTPAVKPLVWDGRQSNNGLLNYRIHIGYGMMNGLFALTCNGSTIGEYHLEEQARISADDHHEMRVLSCLVGGE